MRKSFEKLYGYSNGPEGIRHALIDGAREVTVDDARLMLIQCSAFSNYLIAIAEAAVHRRSCARRYMRLKTMNVLVLGEPQD
jgi:hypothetical protein